jgi:hypothetical protein
VKNANDKDLGQLRDLNSDIGLIEQQIDQEAAKVVDLEGKRAALEVRLAETQTRQPAEEIDLDDPLALALAGDPGAQLASDDIRVATEASSRRQSDVRSWRKEISLIERAIGIVDRDTTAARERESGLRADLRSARIAFFRAAHPYLLLRLREAIDGLRETVLGPLLGIEQMTEDRDPLIRRNANRVFDESVIMYVDGYGNGSTKHYLFPPRPSAYSKPDDCQAEAEKFRLSLGGSAAD